MDNGITKMVSGNGWMCMMVVEDKTRKVPSIVMEKYIELRDKLLSGIVEDMDINEVKWFYGEWEIELSHTVYDVYDNKTYSIRAVLKYDENRCFVWLRVIKYEDITTEKVLYDSTVDIKESVAKKIIRKVLRAIRV